MAKKRKEHSCELFESVNQHSDKVYAHTDMWSMVNQLNKEKPISVMIAEPVEVKLKLNLMEQIVSILIIWGGFLLSLGIAFTFLMGVK